MDTCAPFYRNRPIAALRRRVAHGPAQWFPGAKPAGDRLPRRGAALPCVTMAPAPDTGAAGAIELSDRQLADYRSDGFVVVEDLVSAAELRALQQVLGAAAAPAGAVHVAAAASVAPPDLALDRRRDVAAGQPVFAAEVRVRGGVAGCAHAAACRPRRRVFAAEVASPRRLRCRSVRAVSGFVSGLRRRLSRTFAAEGAALSALAFCFAAKRRREPRPPASSPPKFARRRRTAAGQSRIRPLRDQSDDRCQHGAGERPLQAPVERCQAAAAPRSQRRQMEIGDLSVAVQARCRCSIQAVPQRNIVRPERVAARTTEPYQPFDHFTNRRHGASSPSRGRRLHRRGRETAALRSVPAALLPAAAPSVSARRRSRRACHRA